MQFFAHFQKETKYLRTGTGNNIYVDENGAVNALSILESVTYSRMSYAISSIN